MSQEKGDKMMTFQKSLFALTNEDIHHHEELIESLLCSDIIYTDYQNGISDVYEIAPNEKNISNEHLKLLFHEITHEIKNCSQSVIRIKILILNIPIAMTLILTPTGAGGSRFSAVYRCNEKQEVINLYIEYQKKKINESCKDSTSSIIKNRL